MLTSVAILLLNALKPITWSHVLDRLCANPALFDQYVRGGDQEFRKWCHSAGLVSGTKSEEMGFTPEPTQVRGASQTWLGLLDGTNIHPKLTGALVLFSRAGGRLRGELLLTRDASNAIRPDSSIRSRNTLFVNGQEDWLSNAKRPAVQVFQKNRGRWKSISETISNYEGVAVTPLRILHGKSAPEPLRIWTRGYPKNMTPSHHATMLEREEIWQFRGAQVKRISDKVLDTPYAALDRLMGRLQRGDKEGVSRLCASKFISDQIFKLNKVSDRATEVIFPGHTSSPGQKKLGLRNANLWFTFVRIGGNWKVAKLEPLPDDY